MSTLPLSARLARSIGTLTKPIRRRGAYLQLAWLDDRMLNDIGLSRSDVEAMRRMW